MKIQLVFWGIDRHGEGCLCGVCDSVGKSYGCAIIRKGKEEPIHVEYAASYDSAQENARSYCALARYTIEQEE